MIAGLHALVRPLVAHLLELVRHLLLRCWNRFRVGAGARFGWILVIDHIGLRIVLLFCTHGINLGRT